MANITNLPSLKLIKPNHVQPKKILIKPLFIQSTDLID